MPQDNASVIVKRDTKSVIDQTPKVNGQMLWTTDIGQDNHIYTDIIDPSDNTVKRIQIGGITPETKQVIQQAVTNASASATSASTSAKNASNSATKAESYAKGGTRSRQGEDTDNAKYYKEQADTSATNASTSATNASTSATTATNKATEASTSATNASNSATQASKKATLAESYAKGGTGTRQGEDTDNAEYYKEQAKVYAESASQGVQPATPTKIGGVKPDGTTITVDNDGTIHLSAQVENSIDTSWHASDHIYEGRDLTVVFASEIANYSDEWAWIQARLNSHNLRGIHVADYIPIKIAEGGGAPAQVHKAEVAGINTYRRTGDGTNEVRYHIDWITRDCYSVRVKWNTENNNNGNSSNAQPFMASNLKNWLDTVVYPRLETKLKNVIKPKRVLTPTRYQSGTTLTDDNSWAWSSFDKLWVPLESEVFDTPVWSTKGFGYGQAVQYPIFANSYEHRMKGARPDGGRVHWWLASAYSGGSASVVTVVNNGLSYYNYASDELFAPLCFRTMEDAS